MAACQQPSQSNFDIQGHRGCRGLLPENSIAAFIKAVELGVTTLELDVVLSSDGKVVVSHESFLNPEICLDPDGKRLSVDTVWSLYQMPYSEIEKCDCGSLGHSDFPKQVKQQAAKPLLIDVINEVKAYCQASGKGLPHFSVEIKSQAKHVFLYHPAISVFADAVIQLVQANLPADKFNIQCFDVLTLQYLNTTYPDVPLAYLVEDVGFKSVSEIEVELEYLGFTPKIYSCYYTMLNQENVNWLHQNGMLVLPWTVNEADEMKSLINMGVDGIITDYPDLLIEIVSNLK